MRKSELHPLPTMKDWWERNKPQPLPAPKVPIVRTLATELDQRAIAAISPIRITYCPGIATKRFSRQIQGATELTTAQRDYVWSTVLKFRRQIVDKELVQLAREYAAAWICQKDGK